MVSKNSSNIFSPNYFSTQIKLLQNYDAANFNVLDQHTDISTCLHVIASLQNNFAANSFEKNKTEKKKRISHDMVFFKEKSI